MACPLRLRPATSAGSYLLESALCPLADPVSVGCGAAPPADLVQPLDPESPAEDCSVCGLALLPASVESLCRRPDMPVVSVIPDVSLVAEVPAPAPDRVAAVSLPGCIRRSW